MTVTGPYSETTPSPSPRQYRKRSRRHWGLVLVATLAVTLGVTVSPVAVPGLDGASQAQAANGQEFDPGNIVSDAVFFDGPALSASQIQKFLESKVPTCYKAAGGPECLRNYRQNTPSIAADAYCKAYQGGTNERASTIVAKVAKACGVSAKALIVLMEKEQSLVTAGSSAQYPPTNYKYQKATGFACPDTAPCDPKFTGIFYQLYYAARQYQRYAAGGFYSWYKLGTNSILVNPKSSCGRVTVNIKSKATVGLYFYTPYVPNKAALSNLYGTGDSCSSYGNRNFWRIFTDWFGSTQIPVRSTVQKTWLAAGGLSGSLGRPRAAQSCNANGYCVQKFTGGYVASTPKGTGFVMTSGVGLSTWLARGGTKSSLGWPRSPESCTSKKVCVQRFTNGYVTKSPATKTRVVTGAIAKAWSKAGGKSGALKLPVAGASCKDGVCTQRFQGGRIASTRTYGTYAVTGVVNKYWVKKRKSIGWPANSAKCTQKNKNVTCRQKFSKGWVVSRTGYTTRTIPGTFGDLWAKKRKTVGTPVTARSCKTTSHGKTCTQTFTKRKIVSTGKGKPRVVRR